MPRKLEYTAADKNMTLDELAAFVQDAMRSGATGAEPVGARVTFGGKIKSVSIDIPATAKVEQR